MAFAFMSNNYSSTGQASFMFAQHHQLPCVSLKIISAISAQILFFNVGFFVTNQPALVKSILKFDYTV